MKALSLKQPFAELVVSGKKTIELRRWNTNFRGNFFVHASKRLDEVSMKKFGFLNLPKGKIVGKAELVDVKIYKDEGDYAKDENKHLANSFWGKYGFILKNAGRLDGPFVNGKLNFWNFEGTVK